MKTHQIGISLGSVLRTWREKEGRRECQDPTEKGQGPCEDTSHRNAEEQELRNSRGLLVKSSGTATLGNYLEVSKGFPGGTVDKNPPANAGDTGLIPGMHHND